MLSEKPLTLFGIMSLARPERGRQRPAETRSKRCRYSLRPDVRLGLSRVHPVLALELCVVHIKDMKESGKADTHVLAGGGIVVRDSARPLIGVVQLRKDNSWVLPKGKLKPGERVVAAAKREVEEETGHDVTVLEFLGSLSHATDGRHKIVQFWHMSASATPVRALTNDVKAVKWLPLPQAIKTLSRPHERVFLSQVGPLAVKAAGESRRARQATLGPAVAPDAIDTTTAQPDSGRFGPGLTKLGLTRLGLTRSIGAWLKRLRPVERRALSERLRGLRGG